MKTQQGWAVVDERDRVRPGDYWLAIYWTRQMAKEQLKRFPECRVVRVVVNELFKP